MEIKLIVSIRFLKVARAVNSIYGPIFLLFGNTNQTMQNPIPKLRQSSIIRRNQVISLKN